MFFFRFDRLLYFEWQLPRRMETNEFFFFFYTQEAVAERKYTWKFSRLLLPGLTHARVRWWFCQFSNGRVLMCPRFPDARAWHTSWYIYISGIDLRRTTANPLFYFLNFFKVESKKKKVLWWKTRNWSRALRDKKEIFFSFLFYLYSNLIYRKASRYFFNKK